MKPLPHHYDVHLSGNATGYAAYAVAIGAMLVAGITALTLIYAVSRLDPPDRQTSQDEHMQEHVSELVSV